MPHGRVIHFWYFPSALICLMARTGMYFTRLTEISLKYKISLIRGIELFKDSSNVTFSMVA
jgi:hypothetical protein